MSDNPKGWSNPLVVALLSAAVAYAGNAYVLVLNASNQERADRARAESERLAEKDKTEADRAANLAKAEADRAAGLAKAEADRILEVIKTGDADKAAANLKFLLDVGLISKNKNIDEYIAERRMGQGIYLPPPSVQPAPISGPQKQQSKNMDCLFEPNSDLRNLLKNYTNALKSLGYVIIPGNKFVDSHLIAVKGDIKKHSITYSVSIDEERPRFFLGFKKDDGITDTEIALPENLMIASGRKFKCAEYFSYGARFDTTLNDIVGDN